MIGILLFDTSKPFLLIVSTWRFEIKQCLLTQHGATRKVQKILFVSGKKKKKKSFFQNCHCDCLPKFSQPQLFSIHQISSVHIRPHLSFIHSLPSLLILLLLQAHYVLLSQALWGPALCRSEETMPAEREFVWRPAVSRRGPLVVLPRQPLRQSHMEEAQGEGLKKQWDVGYFKGIDQWYTKNNNVHRLPFRRNQVEKTCLLSEVKGKIN